MFASLLTAAALVACEPEFAVESLAQGATDVHIDFESFPAAPLSHLPPFGFLSRPAAVVRDEIGNKVLRVDYPKGRVGPKESGVLFLVVLPAATEYYLSYRLRLDDGFDFRNGGKLPGLSSEGCRFSGGRVPSTGEGWSARLAWTSAGSLGVYLYHAGMSGPWGDLLRLNAGPLRKNEWHTLVQRVRLNHGEGNDGILQVWLDGELVLDRSDVKFRGGNKGAVEALCFSTFHGGSDPEVYGPNTTGTAFFDEIAVSSSALRETVYPVSDGPNSSESVTCPSSPGGC